MFTMFQCVFLSGSILDASTKQHEMRSKLIFPTVLSPTSLTTTTFVCLFVLPHVAFRVHRARAPRSDHLGLLGGSTALRDCPEGPRQRTFKVRRTCFLLCFSLVVVWGFAMLRRWEGAMFRMAFHFFCTTAMDDVG